MPRLRRQVRISYNYASDSETTRVPTAPEGSRRSARASRRQQNYNEDSDGDSSTSTHSESSVTRHYIKNLQLQRQVANDSAFIIGRDEVLRRPRKRRRISTRNKPQHSPRFSPQNNVIDLTGSVKRQSNWSHSDMDNSPKPPWQELPFHILQNIFAFASTFFYDRSIRSGTGLRWLLQTSTLCKSFREAGLSALLYSPPLFPSESAHDLITLLEKDQTQLSSDYRTKIKYLEIDVKNTLVRKSGIDLLRLIRSTPVLTALRLYHTHDELTTLVWAQPSVSRIRWAYPEALFDVMDAQRIVLQRFEWNGRFPRPMDALSVMHQMHPRPCLNALRKLSCYNLNMYEKRETPDFALAVGLLNGALRELHHLRSLTFRACDIVCDDSVSQLPGNLEYLEFVNCQYLTSEALEAYLLAKGNNMRTLNLDGNQSMSLTFMSKLKTICPKLQELIANLSYIDATSYRDREPLFDELFAEGPPTWPTTLQLIQLNNLRNLDKNEAEAFLLSLTESADNLPDLRCISINAILKDVEWRDRAQMRQKWLNILEETFLRCPPVPPIVYKKMWEPPKGNKSSKRKGRHSSRIKEVQQRRVEVDQQMRDASARKGHCHTVYFMVSDQRPAQDQYRENDFLDSEPSDDGDFRG